MMAATLVKAALDPVIGRRKFASLLAAAACTALPLRIGTALAAPGTQRTAAVFAHYMVCCPAAGGAPTLDDFRKEITAAQNRGIDGFALNCGGWAKEPHYQARSQLMFDAAAGSEFKLFFSADQVTAEEASDMVSRFEAHGNYFRHQGKPVLSSFAGDPEWGQRIVGNLARQGIAVFFVPYFYPKPASELPSAAAARQVFAAASFADGFFYFGATGRSDELVAATARIAPLWLAAGKVFMASVTPFYRGLGGNYRAFETRGFEAMAAEWEAAIELGATWIEIVTWNDWGEASYVAPFGRPSSTLLWEDHWGPMLSHVAYLDASRYYIDWFKSGSRPAIELDRLYYFYRLHPTRLPGRIAPDQTRQGLPKNAGTLEDRVFATLFLKGPASLTILSGRKSENFDLPAGIHHVSSPFDIGAQRFIVKRGESVIIDKTGEFEINRDPWSNYNYFAGSGVP